jgi:hypothetical protein
VRLSQHITRPGGPITDLGGRRFLSTSSISVPGFERADATRSAAQTLAADRLFHRAIAV